MGRSKKEENPLWERVEQLKKNSEKTGFIYGQLDKKEKGKKPPKLSQDGMYRLRLMHFQFHLYEIILSINDIDRSYYFAETGKRVDLVNDIKLNDTFMELSKLDWRTPSKLDGLQFRGRFVTNLLFKIVRKTDSILTNQAKQAIGYRDWKYLKRKEKYSLMNEMLEEWIGMIDRLTLGLLSSNINYLPDLLDVERVLIRYDGGNDTIMKHLSDTDILLASNDEAGLKANNATKMAYVLVTHRMNLKYCPGYNEDLAYLDNKSVLEQVSTLGYAILMRRKKGLKPTLIYDAFQKSNPLIESRFYTINEEAPEVTVGLRALAFSSMFYSESARKTIDKLM